MDDCSDATTQIQRSVVEYTTAPILSVLPVDTTGECHAIQTAPIRGIGCATSSDNCDTSVTIIFIENIITIACGSTIERTWTATDDCGSSEARRVGIEFGARSAQNSCDNHEAKNVHDE